MKLHKFRSWGAALMSAAAMMCASTPARAGIPVIDVASIIQAMLDVLNGINQVQNQYQQIVGLGDQIRAISQARSLGDVLNSPLLQNYVPPNARSLVTSLENGGYSTLSGAAKTLRDAQMTYNCLDITNPAQQASCQASLAKPYQQKAVLEAALDSASSRVAQINSLMRRAGSTVDDKEIQEVTARITGEVALLQHESSQIELMRGLAEADKRVEESRAREAQLQQASRTGRLADFIQR